MKRVRAGAIILKDGGESVLVIQRTVKGDVYFVFPGGGVEAGETLEETALRETREETSVEVKVEKFLYRIIDENVDQNYFLCAYISGEPKTEDFGDDKTRGNEPNDYTPMWKKRDELLDLLIFPLEAVDWFVADYKNNFADCPRTLTSTFGARKKKR